MMPPYILAELINMMQVPSFEESMKTMQVPPFEESMKLVGPKIPDATTIISFEAQSPLKLYLDKITKIPKIFYTLGEVVAILQRVILDEEQCVPANPCMVMCSPALSEALQCTALHKSEVAERVMTQVTQPSYYDLSRTGKKAIKPGLPTRGSPALTINMKAPFKVKSNYFRSILSSVDKSCNSKTIFTFGEVASTLSKYIVSRKDRLFDSRHPRAALVGGDPLGRAFRVSVFHRFQLEFLILRQLIPIKLRRSVRKQPKKLQ